MQLKWADSIWERRELSNWRNVEIRPLSSLFPSCLFTLGVSAQLTLPSLYYAAMLCSCFLEQKKGWKILIKQNPDSNSSWEFQFSKAKNSAAGCRMPLSWLILLQFLAVIEFSLDCLVAILENVRTHFYENETSSVNFVIAINVVVSFYHIIQFLLKWRSQLPNRNC